jgi:hypothetical protein
METFRKRQRERQRLDKQRDKVERRLQRKLHPVSETDQLKEQAEQAELAAASDAAQPLPDGTTTLDPTVNR